MELESDIIETPKKYKIRFNKNKGIIKKDNPFVEDDKKKVLEEIKEVLLATSEKRYCYCGCGGELILITQKKFLNGHQFKKSNARHVIEHKQDREAKEVIRKIEKIPEMMKVDGLVLAPKSKQDEKFENFMKNHLNTNNRSCYINTSNMGIKGL